MVPPALEDLRQRATRLPSSLSTEEACIKLTEHVPASYSVSELLELTQNLRPGENPRAVLLAIAACLEHRDRLCSEPDDNTAASGLATWIATSIAPVNRTPDTSDDTSFPPAFGGTIDPDPYPEVSSRILTLAEPGLRALHSLFNHFEVANQSITLPPETVITLISLTDTTQSWSTPASASLAAKILSRYLSDKDVKSFLVDTVLTDYLKPLFSRTRRPAGVTASGRKAAFAPDNLDTKEHGLPDDSARTKPWKFVDLRSIPVLTWAVERAAAVDEIGAMQGPYWHLYVPPLLTLLDDPSTRVRAGGLALAARFLEKFPVPRLRATGLASVFEDAVFPTLSYLPSLTPEDESVTLLDPAFDALLVLAGKLSDSDTEGDLKREGDGKREERRLLDKVMRGGILTGYFHCPEHPRIVELLMRKTGTVVEALGIGAVKHLKDLVPVLKGVITDAFASARPGTMREGVLALQLVIRNCWPRLVEGVWSEEVFGILVLGWVGLLDAGENGPKGRRETEDKEDIDGIRQDLRKTMAMLAAVVRSGGADLAEKTRPLVDKEPALNELFHHEVAATTDEPAGNGGPLVDRRTTAFE